MAAAPTDTNQIELIAEKWISSFSSSSNKNIAFLCAVSPEGQWNNIYIEWDSVDRHYAIIARCCYDCLTAAMAWHNNKRITSPAAAYSIAAVPTQKPFSIHIFRIATKCECGHVTVSKGRKINVNFGVLHLRNGPASRR